MPSSNGSPMGDMSISIARRGAAAAPGVTKASSLLSHINFWKPSLNLFIEKN